MEQMRLNRFIAHYTGYSRREADRLILEGMVKVNGKSETNPGYRVQTGDRVAVKGKPVKRRRGYTCIVYNKPKGELVTKKDPLGRPTIYHSLPSRFKNFRYVGRLDFASEGLLILTNNPQITTLLTQSELPRVYKIKIDGPVTDQIIKGMEKGAVVGIDGGHSKTEITALNLKPFQNFQILKNGERFSVLKVAITEGKNRELRRFFKHYGREVLDLKRLSYGWVSLNALPTGKWRFFTFREYKLLKRFLNWQKEGKEN